MSWKQELAYLLVRAVLTLILLVWLLWVLGELK
jgi:hypothetical protein